MAQGQTPVPAELTPVIISPRTLERNPDIDFNEVTSMVVNNFRIREAHYSHRNERIWNRRRWYSGDHWTKDAQEGVEEDAVELVFNYVRNIVLRFVATFVRHPRPRVPVPTTPETGAEDAAQNRERFLLAIWPDIKRAWRDVELNAAKCAYGIFHAVWDPPTATEVKIGRGEDQTTQSVYTSSPVRFRSVKPEMFYPIYRTYDHPDDFLYIFFHEPRRLARDLELKYGVSLMAQQMDQSRATDTSTVSGSEPTVELVAYWDTELYILVAISKIVEFGEVTRARGLLPPKQELIETEQYAVLEFMEHELPRIPFWVLQNIRTPDFDPTFQGSISDIDDIIDLNKHYNWIVSEEADEIATHIHRPLFYLSDEHQQNPNDLKFTPGAVNPIGAPGDEEITSIPWDPEPGFVQQHLDRTLENMKEIAFLGEPGFGNLPPGTSGVAAKVALTPMEQIIELKLPQRQDLLQSVCKFVLQIFEENAEDTKFQGYVKGEMNQFGTVDISADDVKQNYFVQIDYGNMLPQDDTGKEQNEVYKFKTGTQSLMRSLDNMNVVDPQSEISRIKDEGMDPELNPERVLLIIQAKRELATWEAEQEQEGQPQLGGAVPPGAEGEGGLAASLFGQPKPLPGTAQQGTRPVQPALPAVAAQEQPPIPAAGALEGNEGPGPAAPFLNRNIGSTFDISATGPGGV